MGKQRGRYSSGQKASFSTATIKIVDFPTNDDVLMINLWGSFSFDKITNAVNALKSAKKDPRNVKADGERRIKINAETGVATRLVGRFSNAEIDRIISKLDKITKMGTTDTYRYVISLPGKRTINKILKLRKEGLKPKNIAPIVGIRKQIVQSIIKSHIPSPIQYPYLPDQ